MLKKQLLKATGVALALAAAGCTSNTTKPAAAGTSAANLNTVEMAHCYGVNQCKGHNDCKTAENACKGHSVCKGHGFVSTPKSACADIGGQLSDDVSWQGDVADLVHCSGINVCKGHNDCKTAENACKGHSACKGHGFVAIPAKACADIGGES